MNPVPAFPSVADAMAVVQAGLRFVAAADATQMSAQAQAQCLQMMERATPRPSPWSRGTSIWARWRT
jgi:hypothetical protein